MGVYNTKTEWTDVQGHPLSIRTETFSDGSERIIRFYPGSIVDGGNAMADTTLVSPQYGEIYSPFVGTNKTNAGYIFGGQTISPET